MRLEGRKPIGDSGWIHWVFWVQTGRETSNEQTVDEELLVPV